ncbi:LLM class flavin-dependent oxidoreductase [Actinomadura sp. ATCC 31491]|uniref:LLM class flavin-dependent oxidoreductase n=1 Tax=Actinomadura luzonensis TaxID=2805427 RepID=A0ABT0FT25_9ACTN|nr:LLM class flavin-dependent oxidoreductase [Actinomadura luzonensis]MCK2215467.1 LLM class flavin-dependent oxidoreductase [Actinomadura luzonensis]
MTHDGTPSFGIKTTPANVGYDDILRVWREADTIPEIGHAWLYDHLVPYVGGRIVDASGPVHEGWTLLTALAVQTRRLRFGLMVTNNRLRPPAVLAKMAATLDVISGGRLDLGIGVGGLPDAAAVAPEYDGYGIPLVPWRAAVAALGEACTVIRRLWTEDVFDFAGRHYRLTGARCSPKPVQRPHPPILIGGSGTATLRVVAEHADVWNAIGPPVNPVEHLVRRAAVLDELCAEIGRDPAGITRSVQLPVSYDDPASARESLRRLREAGFSHFVLNLPSPYPPGAASWAAEELIGPVRG